ncbi:MAG: hypothetical protein LLG42_00365 [Chloroflexi bacterium]|nr:hypothetical protein [Chloroflexota bacterium]
MNDPVTPVCPKCGLSDQVEKVSVLATSQSNKTVEIPVQLTRKIEPVDQSTLNTENPAINSIPDAELRKKLTPPKQPESKSPINCAGGLFMLLSTVALTGVVAGYLAGIQRGITQWQQIFYGSIAFSVFFIFMTIRYTRSFFKDLHAFQDKSEKEMAAWQKSMEKWDRLYYCQRDDCVFDPDQNVAVAPADLKTYLKEP